MKESGASELNGDVDDDDDDDDDDEEEEEENEEERLVVGEDIEAVILETVVRDWDEDVTDDVSVLSVRLVALVVDES